MSEQSSPFTGRSFAATASNSRVFADMARLMGFFEAGDYRRRVLYRNGFIIAITAIPVILILLVKSPVKMVVAGGISQALMLPVIRDWDTLPASSPPAAADCAATPGDDCDVGSDDHHRPADGLLRH
jgi:hypothetical protein